MTTAADVITETLHLFGITDQTETPTPTDIANNVIVLNQLLREEHADAAASYLVRMHQVILPPSVLGQIYTFSVGVADSNYLLQVDAVGIRQLFMNDINLTVNRETRPAPKADVVRTTYPGIITKWHQERQTDGSVLITAWQGPRSPAPALIELGERIAPLVNPDGSDIVGLPPEGISDVVLMLGRRIHASYGKNPQSIAVQLQDAEQVNMRWRTWARGQQWARFVRA